MKWSTFKYHTKRLLICSWKGHTYERDSPEGAMRLFWCDYCGGYDPKICIPEFDPANVFKPTATLKEPFQQDKFATYSIHSERTPEHQEVVDAMLKAFDKKKE